MSSSAIELSKPNGGLVMGTREGMLGLQRDLADIPTFPCCPADAYGPQTRFVLPPCRACKGPKEPKLPRCAVSSQACLQAALLRSRRLAAPPARAAAVIDENASLFLSVYGLEPGELALGDDGRLRHTPTGTTPCVMHFNGANSPLRSGVFRGIGKRSRVTWSPTMALGDVEPGWMALGRYK